MSFFGKVKKHIWRSVQKREVLKRVLLNYILLSTDEEMDMGSAVSASGCWSGER